jgi:hypothetical protein
MFIWAAIRLAVGQGRNDPVAGCGIFKEMALKSGIWALIRPF